jgi:hypothetical protein
MFRLVLSLPRGTEPREFRNVPGELARRRIVRDFGESSYDLRQDGPLAVTDSTADFNRDTRRTFEREGTSAHWCKVYNSTADEGTAIVYPDDDSPAVADVCYPNGRPEGKSSMCGG